MKKTGLACVTLVVACGGSDNANIDGGDNDATSNDAIATDVGAPDGSGNDATPSDSGPVNDASDSASFSPGNVQGLVLWLEADVQSSITTTTTDAGIARITTWADQTSHHNDAHGNTVNFTVDPTVKSGAINSLDAVHFDQQPKLTQGNMLTIADNADKSLQWGTGDFFVAIVGGFDNALATNGPPNLQIGNFFSKEPYVSGGSLNSTPPPSTYTGVVFFGNAPGNPPASGLFFGTANTSGDSLAPSAAYNTGAAHLFILRRRGAKLDLFVDKTNVATTTTTNPNVSSATLPIRIGADGDATLVRLNGEIGEMLAVKGALAVGDEASVVAYLRAKWATP